MPSGVVEIGAIDREGWGKGGSGWGCWAESTEDQDRVVVEVA